MLSALSGFHCTLPTFQHHWDFMRFTDWGMMTNLLQLLICSLLFVLPALHLKSSAQASNVS
jgi:hypothetical protein